MAKENSNSTDGQSPSYNAMPYDANNSFVRKVATKVTDFIPHGLWKDHFSKWFNSSQNDENALDIRENPEELANDMQQPPSKRPRIRMDVIHPPGTFSIEPRGKTALNKVDPSKEQYSIHNKASEDFLEPLTAGPSRTDNAISSTSAMQDIRTVTSHRADLNSLTVSTNNGTANGMDDHSESSESTSGCSSLIPQINRHEGPSNFLYSTFSNRKRHIDDKLTFTNHLQSPRSLFLDRTDSRDTLSSRRPSFNASVITNVLDRATPLSSPFYSGNITFGGANAAGLYKQGRSTFSDSNELLLKVPRRTNVEVKSSNMEIDSSGMSQTAKKILEALDHFSSPISDAKKIPLRNTNNVSLLMNKKEPREERTLSVRVGLRHLTRELTVPTVPDILKLRRRQKLQDTTLAVRKIVSARNDPPLLSQVYQIRTEDNDKEKYHGKIRGKSKINLEEEETIEPVNLPNIPLPISTLPNFNFTLPLVSHTASEIATNKEDTFTFASPIKVTEATKNLKSFNHFIFSNPINAEDDKNNLKIDWSSMSRTVASATSIDPVVTSMPNFIWSHASTAPRLKEKVKTSKNSFIAPAIGELKSGSVMDILCPKSNKMESTSIAQSNLELISKGACTKTANILASDLNMKNTRDVESSSSASDTTRSLFDWECSECLIRNSNSNKQCIACKVARPDPNEKVLPPSSKTDIVVKTKPVANDCFGSQFKLSTNQWECTVCYVRNKQNDDKCVACSMPKTENKTKIGQIIPTTIKSQKFDLMEKFKPAEGSWECSGCLLRNAATIITCPCCNTSNPNSIKTSLRKTDVVTESSVQRSISVDSESIDMTKQATESSNSEIMNKFKPSKDSWECPGCLVRNNSFVITCPCCSTTKPSSIKDSTTKTEQISAANGCGDQFKKSEGSSCTYCDSCLLQNKMQDTKCMNCQTSKLDSKNLNESTANTSSILQFKFGVPSSTGEFKFVIDKAENQSKSDIASPVNGFKFGNAQQDSSVAHTFTFGMPKKENEATSEVSKTNNVATSSSNTGFQFNVRNTEKSDTKSDEENKLSASFNVPKSDSSTIGNEKQSASIASSVTSLSASSVMFDIQKSGLKPTLNKEVITVTQSSKPIVASNSLISVNTTLPSLLVQNYTSQNDSKPTPIFSFGIPSNTNAASSNSSTNVTTTCLPTIAQPSFRFSDPKTTQIATMPSFNQVQAPPYAAITTNLSFGTNKVAETTSNLLSDKPAISETSTASIFPIVSNSTSLFNNNESKPPIVFGADKQSAFASTDSKLPAFAISKNKISTFSSGTENKSAIFGMSETKLPVFGNNEKSISVFNSSAQTIAVNPLPTFGASSSATPSPFESSSGSVFGNVATPAFGAATTPTIFPSTTKPNESNTSKNSSVPLFTFDSNQSTQQSATGGFIFSANADSVGSAPKQPLFTFGSTLNTSQNNNVFGSGTFANPAPNTANFTFNAPKQETTAFGQNTVGTSMFSANSQTQATTSFSSTPSSSTGFNFGPTSSTATPSGGFNFGGMSSTSTPTDGFNFNPPASAPTLTFDPNSRPSFNFTKGSVPTAFNAPPQSASATPQRKIKKAFRRCVR